MEDEELTEKIIGCAYKVHNAPGPGVLEKVYENALRIEIEKLGLIVKNQSMSSMMLRWSVSIMRTCSSIIE